MSADLPALLGPDAPEVFADPPSVRLSEGGLVEQLPPALRRGLKAALELADNAIAKSTRDVYDRAFIQFRLWCEDQGVEMLPASKMTVVAYLGFLVDERSLSASRVGVVMSAIGWEHRRRHLPDPTADEIVSMAMRGTRRLEAETRVVRKAKALTGKIGELPNEIARIVDAIEGDDLASLRDRALILLGWAGAFRRSELASLTLGDLHWRADKIWIPARKSKTDQEGRDAAEGKGKAIFPSETPSHCPVRMTRRWLDALEAASGREAAAGQESAQLPLFVGFRAGKPT